MEKTIKEDLIRDFHFLDGKIIIPRPRRIIVEVPYEKFWRVFDYAVNKLKFPHLCTITGLDLGENFGLIYHLAADSGIMLNIKTTLPKADLRLKTVTHYFPGAEIYERELMDLLGFQVEGLPAGDRYPLTDDWPVDQFPLRKDWKASPEEKQGGSTNA